MLKIDFMEKGFHFKSEETDKGNSVVTISKGDEIIKQFTWPTYKIFNISAHASDIVGDIEEGLMIAGSTGFGGNVYKEDK